MAKTPIIVYSRNFNTAEGLFSITFGAFEAAVTQFMLPVKSLPQTTDGTYQVKLIGNVTQAAAAAYTLKLRIGGGWFDPDGDIVATATGSGTGTAEGEGSFAIPDTAKFLKITGVSANSTVLRNAQIVIQGSVDE